MVCFNHEERVAGLMSEVCPFLKEMKGRDRDPLRSLVRSKYYLRARTGRKVLYSLNCLSTMVVRAGIVTGDTLCEPSLASWFLAIKSEEGNKATFSHWPRLDTCLQPRHGFRCACRRPKLARNSFGSKMFEVCVFHRLKGCFCELIENNRK